MTSPLEAQNFHGSEPYSSTFKPETMSETDTTWNRMKDPVVNSSLVLALVEDAPESKTSGKLSE